MTPGQFLECWKSEHIHGGMQQADALALVEELLADAGTEGISRDVLAQAAGGGLITYIVGAIREAVKQNFR